MSQRNSGYARKEKEDFFTPTWVTHCLLNKFNFPGGIYDPCCGDGQIIKACEDFGIKANGADLYNYGFKPGGIDFLKMERLPKGFNSIITNPPYGSQGKLAVAFIEKALSLVKKKGGMVAFLLRKDFDSAKSRQHLFDPKNYFHAEITLQKRIQWTNLDHVASSSQNHSWFVWDTGLPRSFAFKFYSHPDGIAVKKERAA